MLFRTVYGAELEALYDFIMQHQNVTKAQVLSNFVMSKSNKMPHRNQNIDDALTFLVSAYLIVSDGVSFHLKNNENLPFAALILKNLRAIELGKLQPFHQYDHLYTYILTETFFKTNKTFIRNLHKEVNTLRKVIEIGGLSKEKIRAWTRVMEFLGVGRRTTNGFFCLIDPNLIEIIVQNWSLAEGTLQEFLQDHVYLYLPYETDNTELATPISNSLLRLQELNIIELFPMQDSPRRAYFQPYGYKGIRKVTLS